MIFGGQPTPWTKAQTDGLMRMYEAMGKAGGAVEHYKLSKEQQAALLGDCEESKGEL